MTHQWEGITSWEHFIKKYFILLHFKIELQGGHPWALALQLFLLQCLTFFIDYSYAPAVDLKYFFFYQLKRVYVTNSHRRCASIGGSTRGLYRQYRLIFLFNEWKNKRLLNVKQICIEHVKALNVRALILALDWNGTRIYS